MPSRLVSLTVVFAACVGLGGCGTSDSPGPDPTGGSRLRVVASFYPLEYAARQIGGEHVTVTSLTRPGTEPHDVELSPKDVAGLSRASLVFYAKGFQPAVDDAVAQEAEEHSLDVAPTAHLDLAAPAEETQGVTEPGARDPHFWLDPTRYRDVAGALATRLAEVDPTHAADYSRDAKTFTDALGALDADLRTGTQSCQIKELVTSHAAFGYLGARYGFTQTPITGLSPDAEPSGATLARVSDFVRSHHITTIYTETLVEPKFAETVARSTGATLATLDPIEGITSTSAGRDYFEVMRSNLAALRAGQGCS